MYDGWTDRSCTHCIGIFAVHIRSVMNPSSLCAPNFEEVVCPLLSCSPMAKMTSSKDDFLLEMANSDDETTIFDSKSHV